MEKMVRVQVDVKMPEETNEEVYKDMVMSTIQRELEKQGYDIMAIFSHFAEKI